MKQTKQSTARLLATQFNFELVEANASQKRRALKIGQPAPRWILHPIGSRWAGETAHCTTLDHALSVLSLFCGRGLYPKGTSQRLPTGCRNFARQAA